MTPDRFQNMKRIRKLVSQKREQAARELERETTPRLENLDHHEFQKAMDNVSLETRKIINAHIKQLQGELRDTREALRDAQEALRAKPYVQTLPESESYHQGFAAALEQAQLDREGNEGNALVTRR